MVLQDLFDTLASGEFANLSLAHSVSDSIKEEAYPRIVSAANRGLRELYKRFLLKKKKVMLFQQEGIIRYYLRPERVTDLGASTPDLYLANHPDEALQTILFRSSVSGMWIMWRWTLTRPVFIRIRRISRQPVLILWICLPMKRIKYSRLNTRLNTPR